MSIWLRLGVDYVKRPFLHSLYGFGQISRDVLPDWYGDKKYLGILVLVQPTKIPRDECDNQKLRTQILFLKCLQFLCRRSYKNGARYSTGRVKISLMKNDLFVLINCNISQVTKSPPFWVLGTRFSLSWFGQDNQIKMVFESSGIIF